MARADADPPGFGRAAARRPVHRTTGSVTEATSPGRYSPAAIRLASLLGIRPDAVLIDVNLPGEPVPKGRPKINRVTANVYTPQATADAEEDWKWVMRIHRTRKEPYAGPVGVLVEFRLSTGKAADGDNLLKLVLDAAQAPARSKVPGLLIADDSQMAEAHLYLARYHASPGTALLVWALP